MQLYSNIILPALVLAAFVGYGPACATAAPASITGLNTPTATHTVTINSNDVWSATNNALKQLVVTIADGADGARVTVDGLTCAGTTNCLMIAFAGAATDVVVDVMNVNTAGTLALTAGATLQACVISLADIPQSLADFTLTLPTLIGTNVTIDGISTMASDAVLGFGSLTDRSNVVVSRFTHQGSASFTLGDSGSVALTGGSTLLIDNLITMAVEVPADITIDDGSVVRMTGADTLLYVFMPSLRISNGGRFYVDGVATGAKGHVEVLLMTLSFTNCGGANRHCLFALANAHIQYLSIDSGNSAIPDVDTTGAMLLLDGLSSYTDESYTHTVFVKGTGVVSIINNVVPAYIVEATNGALFKGQLEFWNNRMTTPSCASLNFERFGGGVSLVGNTCSGSRLVWSIINGLPAVATSNFACNTVFNGQQGTMTPGGPAAWVSYAAETAPVRACDINTRIPRCAEGYDFYYDPSGSRADPPTAGAVAGRIASCLQPPQVWPAVETTTTTTMMPPFLEEAKPSNGGGSTAGAVADKPLGDDAKIGIIVSVAVGVPILAIAACIFIYRTVVNRNRPGEAADLDDISPHDVPTPKDTKDGVDGSDGYISDDGFDAIDGIDVAAQPQGLSQYGE